MTKGQSWRVPDHHPVIPFISENLLQLIPDGDYSATIVKASVGRPITGKVYAKYELVIDELNRSVWYSIAPGWSPISKLINDKFGLANNSNELPAQVGKRFRIRVMHRQSPSDETFWFNTCHLLEELPK